MEYDPIKDRLSSLLDSRPRLLPILFGILDLLFLRTWYVHRVLRNLSLGPGSRLLDACTGLGQYAWYVLRKYSGVSVTGIDVKKDYLDRAARCFLAFGLSDRVKLLVDDVTKPQAKGAFDCILAMGILEHIEDELGGSYARFAPRSSPSGITAC
ncbi:MAG: class I SAM-dependent methyltransferase [Bacteroidetes bacterium]|nr:class I SAM-dependent methyltransferase [Bacteroidota bacterium]